MDDIIEKALSAAIGALAFAQTASVIHSVRLRLFWKKVRDTLRKIVR